MTVYRIIIDTFDTTANMKDVIHSLIETFYYINHGKRIKSIMELNDIE
jgi:hypothetical protein